MSQHNQTEPKLVNSKSNPSSSSGGKPNASAPSEQELKEEEELQLALALSLSEPPVKFSYPEIREFEIKSQPEPDQQHTADRSEPIRYNTSTDRNEPVQHIILDRNESAQQSVPDRDHEVLQFVNEVRSTLEVFTNRLESCKLRNRAISNDAAIQSLFLRLNGEVQPKLSEYMNNYDTERADFERMQDKLSQIADARAALDALREEHQEKLRQQAAEADRLRQTQLATKLEAMRQKKSQMMQYQREIAMQRIREQEMGLQLPDSTQGYQPSSVTSQQQVMQKHPAVDSMQSAHQISQRNHLADQHTTHQEWNQTNNQHHLPNYSTTQQINYGAPQYSSQQVSGQPMPISSQVQHTPLQQTYEPPVTSVPAQVPVPTVQPSIDRASIAQLERQFLPNSKPEEDTPLISFDD